MKKIVIIGSGGAGREVLDLINCCNLQENKYEPLGFVVDPEYGTPGTVINEKPILGGFDWLEKYASEIFVTIAIGQPNFRFQILQRIKSLNCKFITLIHPWTKKYLHKWVDLGEGIILNGCQISCQIKIGNFSYVNAFTVIGHDTTLSDFVTVAPSVSIDGFVKIGTGAFIGTGSSILPKVSVGEWSIIGAGSVISKDVPANSTAFNPPPRILGQQEPGWHLK